MAMNSLRHVPWIPHATQEEAGCKEEQDEVDLTEQVAEGAHEAMAGMDKKLHRGFKAYAGFLELPLLPFPSDQASFLVLVPSEAKTLHLFEARYLKLLDECLLKKKKLFVHFVLDPIAVSSPSEEASFAARYACLALIEKVEQLDIGALVSIRGIGRVTLVKFAKTDPFLEGIVLPLLDNVPQNESEVTSKVLELKEALEGFNHLQIKLKAAKDEPLRTQTANSLDWAVKNPSLDCEEAFIPSYAERISFAALQNVSEVDAANMCCVGNSVESWILDSRAWFHAVSSPDMIKNLRTCNFGKLAEIAAKLESFESLMADIASLKAQRTKSDEEPIKSNEDSRSRSPKIPLADQLVAIAARLDTLESHLREDIAFLKTHYEPPSNQVKREAPDDNHSDEEDRFKLDTVKVSGDNPSDDEDQFQCPSLSDLWHQRLGHMIVNGMKMLAAKGKFLDLKLMEIGFCESCVLERINRTLNERARSMRLNVGLPKTFWDDVVNTATYLINHGPSVPMDEIMDKSGESVTPEVVFDSGSTRVDTNDDSVSGSIGSDSKSNGSGSNGSASSEEEDSTSPVHSSSIPEFGKKQPDSPLYCDNHSAIHLGKNPVFHRKTKHIQLRCHFIRGLISVVP
ncbi:hypothetical protein E3N88_10282 [Mikania micrantha]|uniref:Uncharacterized protein n=1 Tax=Mikania micrantha TaxID=192012 RepID=A0A5N6PA22_9ASTR|nr:hypothetical protein E3N88_10282 [Mikania micrantha]